VRIIQTLFAVCLAASAAFSITVEEAYQAIPHHRTVFQAAEAAMPAGESAYLTQLFTAVDQAIVAKVQAGRGESVESSYAPVWAAWGRLKAPAKLQKIQDLFRRAIENEQASLSDSQGRVNAADARTHEASQALQEAYSELMRLYPAENQNNRQAFFDYPCALDFF